MRLSYRDPEAKGKYNPHWSVFRKTTFGRTQGGKYKLSEFSQHQDPREPTPPIPTEPWKSGELPWWEDPKPKKKSDARPVGPQAPTGPSPYPSPSPRPKYARARIKEGINESQKALGFLKGVQSRGTNGGLFLGPDSLPGVKFGQGLKNPGTGIIGHNVRTGTRRKLMVPGIPSDKNIKNPNEIPGTNSGFGNSVRNSGQFTYPLGKRKQGNGFSTGSYDPDMFQGNVRPFSQTQENTWEPGELSEHGGGAFDLSEWQDEDEFGDSLFGDSSATDHDFGDVDDDGGEGEGTGGGPGDVWDLPNWGDNQDLPDWSDYIGKGGKTGGDKTGGGKTGGGKTGGKTGGGVGGRTGATGTTGAGRTGTKKGKGVTGGGVKGQEGRGKVGGGRTGTGKKGTGKGKTGIKYGNRGGGYVEPAPMLIFQHQFHLPAPGILDDDSRASEHLTPEEKQAVIASIMNKQDEIKGFSTLDDQTGGSMEGVTFDDILDRTINPRIRKPRPSEDDAPMLTPEEEAAAIRSMLQGSSVIKYTDPDAPLQQQQAPSFSEVMRTIVPRSRTKARKREVSMSSIATDPDA